jgi:hypothetical protein
LDQRLEQIGVQEPGLAAAVARWVTVPGIDRVAAWSLVAEVGTTWLSSPVLRIWRAGRAYVRATTRPPERDWEAPCVKAALGCAA